MTTIHLTVNGKPAAVEAADSALLVEVLRDQLRLTGTHIGCDTTQCGACTVHLDGLAVKSCTVLAAQADGGEVLTIEGLARGDVLHPLQQAFREHHGLQCGYCTPGMIMAALDMVRRHGEALNEEIVRNELEGNLCRCTGYQNIVAAVLAAARVMTRGDAQPTAA
jgi:carbon-monoxide dehydrogenase small subunit